jgi:hypothetical protein
MLSSGPTVEAYNIKAGPLNLSLGAQAGVEYSDNANNSGTSPKEDFGFIAGPTIGGGLALPIRIGNSPEENLTMHFGTGFQYRYYLNEGQQTTFNSPSSLTLALPLHLGEWLVTINDAFTYTDEPLDSLVAVGVRRPQQYNNLGSITGMRRFGRFALTLVGQRIDRWAPQTPSTEETIYGFSVTPAVFLQEQFSVFWANSVGLVFPKDLTNRSEGLNITSMIGVSGQITPAIAGSVGIGFVHSQFDPVQSGTSTNTGSGTDGVSANIGLNYSHPLRPNTSHAISMFYTPGVTATMDRSNYQTSYGVAYTISHRLNRTLTFSPMIGWTHSQNESGGFQSEFDMLLLGVGIQRSFTRHLSGRLTYRHQERSGNQPGQSYQVNQVTITFTYAF